MKKTMIIQLVGNQHEVMYFHGLLLFNFNICQQEGLTKMFFGEFDKGLKLKN